MALRELSARGFRNLQPLRIELAPGANYLYGPNAAGKTNLLEAIHYLAIGRSFRRSPDSELLGFDHDVLVVAGADDGDGTGELRFDGREKRLYRNDTAVERLSDYFGWLPVVVLLLEDIELVRGSPGLRRGFLDMAIAKTDREYIGIAAAYRRALQQRNRLFELSSAETEQAAWDEELVRTGVPVSERRRAAAGRLLGRAEAFFERLAHRPAQFRYRSGIGDGDDPAGEFRTRLAATQARARELRQTLVGPHRDDVRIEREGRDLRRFGSVGEQRLAGIALRLAEADLLLESVPRRPVFLLDEIASELDDERSRLVLDLIEARGQMVYAAARRLNGTRGLAAFARDTGAPREFLVESGRVSETA